MSYDEPGHPCPTCGAQTGYALCVPCQDRLARQSNFPLQSQPESVILTLPEGPGNGGKKVKGPAM